MVAPDTASPSAFLIASDPQLALVTLFIPSPYRQAVQTLYAFNGELMRVRSLVSDPLPGEIRLQWWREVLEGKRAAESAGHPLATALLEVIKSHHLPVEAFYPLLDARIDDLYANPYPTREALEHYFLATYGTLLRLSARCWGPLHEQHEALFDETALALGWVYLLLSLPQQLQSSKTLIPLGDRERISIPEPRRGKPLALCPALSALLTEYRELVREHYHKASTQLFQSTSLPYKNLFLPLLLVPLQLRYANRMSKRGQLHSPSIPLWRTAFALWQGALQLKTL